MRFGKEWVRYVACVLVSGIVWAEQDGLRLTAPADKATVATLSEGQKAYVTMPRKERVDFFANASKRKKMRALGYYPQPLKLVWEGIPTGTKAEVSVYRLPDRTRVFHVETTEKSVQVDNLEIARDYEWRVTANGKSQAATFRTEDIAPRLIRIPGVPNVRDLGGRIGLGGKRVKQGRVFRSAGLNDNAGDDYLTEAELKASGRMPALDKEKQSLEASQKRIHAFQKNPGTFKLVKNGLKSKWTMFRLGRTPTDAEQAELARLTTVPATLFSVAAEQVEASSKHGNFHLAKPADKPVVFLQEFDSDSDGYLSVAISSSQTASIRMNGEMVYDLFRISNKVRRFEYRDRFIPLPVKQGKNLIVAIVDTQKRERAWRCTPSPAEPVTRLLANADKYLQYRLRYLYRVYKGKKPGQNRVSETTLPYVLNVLGIKSDIDLRSDGECFGMTGSPLGPSVTWFHYSSSAYGGMQTETGRQAFKKVFRVFLDEKNYPIDFHCIAGQDRTGAVAFILNGLLGVSEEDLYLDWEVTGFWNENAGFNHKNRFDHLVNGFQKLKGENLHEKIENYVLSLGFTRADIEKFRSIMLE